MQNSTPSGKLFSIGEASEYLGVSIDTLRRWEKRDRITPLRSPGGHRYYSQNDLDGLFNKRYTRDEETVRRTQEELGKTEGRTETADIPKIGISSSFSESDIPKPPSADIPQPVIGSAPPVSIPEPEDSVNSFFSDTFQRYDTSISEKPEPMPETSPPAPLSPAQPVTDTPSPDLSLHTGADFLLPNIKLQNKDSNLLSEEDIEKRLNTILKSDKKSTPKKDVFLYVLSAFVMVADAVLLFLWISSSRIVSPIP